MDKEVGFLTRMCSVLSVSSAAFYEWVRNRIGLPNCNLEYIYLGVGLIKLSEVYF